ncbi:MAG: carbon storage regulator CsrA [Spirochaetales bacterium]
MLILSRKKDQKILIGDGIEIWVVDLRGDTVKLGIKAPKEVKVYRQEVALEIQAANQAALSSSLDLPFPDVEPPEHKTD